ncbi:MAG: reverse transcriptase-like protein [Bacilli bacterium]
MGYLLRYTLHTPKHKAPTETGPCERDEAMAIAEWLRHKNIAHEIIFIDEWDTEWNLKQMKKRIEEEKSSPYKFTAYFDGAFDHNTEEGSAGVAIYIESAEETIRIRKNMPLGRVASSTEAETLALLFLFETLEAYDYSALDGTVIGDAKGTIETMLGNYPVYDPVIERYISRAEALVKRLKLRVRYEHVLRHDNKEAHMLAMQGMQGELVEAQTPIKGGKRE